MSDWIKLYGTIISKEIRRFFIYRSNIPAGLLSAFFSLAVRYALWAALFSAGNAQSSTLRETMTFYVVNGILLVWISTRHGNIIGEDIRSGDIAGRLIEPVPYHLHLIAVSHAKSLTKTFIETIPTFIAALIFIGLLPPVSPLAFLCFILTAMLGGVIYSLVDLIISYTAFWLTEYWYLEWFKRALFMLFGGMTIPLWFYPDWLNAICGFLPFRYAVFQPIGFYLGRVPSGEIGISLLLQLLWIAALFLLERIVWGMAQRKITVQGG